MSGVPRIRRLQAFFISLFVCGLLVWLAPTQFLDRKLLDTQFGWLRNELKPIQGREIVLVGIDEETLTTFPEPLAIWHKHLGSAFQAIAGAEPHAVVVDMVLPDKSYDFMQMGLDRALFQGVLALKQNTSLVLARTVDETGQIKPTYAPLFSLVGEDRIGLALIRPDADGVVRRMTYQLASSTGLKNTLLGAINNQMGLPSPAGLINYSIGSMYEYYPLQQIVQLADTENSLELQRIFRDRVVIVGSVLPFRDRHQVPVPLTAWEAEQTRVPGMLVHAQQLLTSMSRTAIEIAPRWLTICLAGLLSLLWFVPVGTVRVVLILLISGSLLVILSTIMLDRAFWLPPTVPVLLAILMTSGRVLLQAIRHWQERRLLKNSFAGYVSPQVLDQLLSGELEQGMQSTNANICVLFSDIVNFTGRSENQEPAQITQLLNRYFALMADAVHHNGGTVDKFIGDGMMAFFGAPNKLEECCEKALLAARDMLDELEQLNLQLVAEEIEPLEINIGLHYGLAAIGHIGSRDRHEYTAIGDVVNTAARLEGVAKQSRFPIVCSAQFRRKISEPYRDGLIEIGETELKGRSSVLVYGWQPGEENCANTI